MNAKFHGVRAWLYDRDQAAARFAGSHFGGHASERGFNCGGVMGKIIIDRYTANRAQMLHAPLDPCKFAQGCSGGRCINPHMARGSNRRKGVSHVMLAGQGPLHCAAIDHFTRRSLTILDDFKGFSRVSGQIRIPECATPGSQQTTNFVRHVDTKLLPR